jgi:hypothetical protein
MSDKKLTSDELEDLVYERTRHFVYGSVADCILELRRLHAENEALRSEIKRLQKEWSDTIDLSITHLGQVYGLISQGKSDEAAEYCRGAAEMWTQDIAAIDAERSKK